MHSVLERKSVVLLLLLLLLLILCHAQVKPLDFETVQTGHFWLNTLFLKCPTSLQKDTKT